jgi:hypothetical protein
MQLENTPELIVIVDFVFPWGKEYPVVFLSQGLFTLLLGGRGAPNLDC